MDKVKAKKVRNILANIVVCAFLAVCIFMLIITFASKKDEDGVAEVFGYQMRIVTSDSMKRCELTDVSDYRIKAVPTRSLVFIKVMPEDSKEADEWYRSLKVGDVLTFRYVYTTQKTITHRIVSIEEKDTGGFIIELAGDNKNSKDGQLKQVIDTSVPFSPNYVIGQVQGQSRVIGFVLSILKTQWGIIFAIILPCMIIIVLEVARIAKVLSADKKKREQEENDKKDSEIAALRQKLAELEQKTNGESNKEDAIE